MQALKQFRDEAAGVPDLLNWAALIDDGVVQCKDGSLLAGFFYRGADTFSSTDGERNWKANRVNSALSQLGAGWATWTEASRLPASTYPAANLSHFPDPISRLVDEERRRQFEREDYHYESVYALIVQFTPPLRRNSKLADLVYDDDPAETIAPATRVLQQFQKDLTELEDAIGDVLELQRMRSFTVTEASGKEVLRDELVNYLHYSLTGEPASLNIPSHGAYLDAFLGGCELFPGDTPRLGDKFIACVAIPGFAAESSPGILDVLDQMPIAYRWSNRMIFMDQHEALGELRKYRRKWKQQVRGFWSQLFKTQGGIVNEDALVMQGEAEAAMTLASSGLISFGYFSSVVVLRSGDRQALMEDARRVARVIMAQGYAARIETVNTTEAWLGAQPGHTLPNVRRPLMHTDDLANLLPLSSVWTGRDYNPCPMYPQPAPPLLHAATTGSTPMRFNLHVGDVGHTLVFGPTGAGKTTLLCTIAMQALRYRDARIWSFDYKRGMLATVKACQGRHYDIAGENGGPSFCPLAVLDTEADMAWAEDWIASCFELQMKRPPTPGEREAIHKAMLNTRADPSARTMTHFVLAVQDETIRSALRFYTLEGAAGGILDAEADGIVDANFIVFETMDLFAMQAETAVPVLLYLFRRFERSLRGEPTYLILDEAWVMLSNPVFRPKLWSWLRLLRSKNCAVIIATQSLADAVRSGILDVLIESCPTRIFLANDEADKSGGPNSPGPRDMYETMGLNERQIEIIKSATKKRHYYLVTPEGRRLIELGLGPVALAFAGASSEKDLKRISQLEAERGEDWPFAWMREKKVDYVSLQ